MPTKRRKIGARRIGGRLNDRQRLHLLIGPALAPRFAPHDPDFASEDEARAAWLRHRAELLADPEFGERAWGARYDP